MKGHVARLLKRPSRTRRITRVTLDREQLELVEKLSVFFTRETNQNYTKGRVIEEAVRAFVDDSAQYIAEEYDIDIRGITLTEMQAYKYTCAVNVGVLDTVVLPVRDDQSSRQLVFSQYRWNPVKLDKDKLASMKDAAFYLCSPTCSISHYARIRSIEPSEGDAGGYVLCFEPPEELGRHLEWEQPGSGRLRRPRYTVLSLILEAKAIEELF